MNSSYFDIHDILAEEQVKYKNTFFILSFWREPKSVFCAQLWALAFVVLGEKNKIVYARQANLLYRHFLDWQVFRRRIASVAFELFS